MQLQYPKNYIVFDFETTGFESGKDQILEIAAIKVSGDRMISEFSRLLKASVPPKITTLTGITQELVDKEGIDPKQAVGEFITFIGSGIPLIGHNIFRFDLNFLFNYACRRVLGWNNGDVMEFGKEIDKTAVDTAAIFKGRLMGDFQKYNETHREFAFRILESINKGIKFNLADAARYYQITEKPTHRAMADVTTTYELYKAMCSEAEVAFEPAR